VSSTEAFQRAVALAIQLELPTTLTVASNPDPTMEEECWKNDLDTMGAKSLHPMAARSLSEVMTTT
jgi:hypothetical protein